MRRWFVRVLIGLLAVACAIGAAFVAAPLPSALTDYGAITSTRIVDRRGALLREVFSTLDGRGTPIEISTLPAHVQAAFLAAEDKGFFSHLGLSPTAVLRAARQNWQAGRVVAGGSTITQQLARTLVPRPRTLGGKIQEALWALRLEVHLSKAQILEQYVNRVPFGNATFGIEAASQLYFGKKAKHLSLGEATLLAAIPRGPTAYNPLRQRNRVEERRRWVLDRLAASDLVSAGAVADARKEVVDVTPFAASFRAPHFISYVIAHLPQWGLSRAAVVRTSLDLELQTTVEQQVAEEVSRLAGRNVTNAAVVVSDNATGDILAYVGSADFFASQSQGQNDGIQMRRQPGSALKPFIYAEAFRQGYTPATVLADIETSFAGGQGRYAPKNYDRRLHGPVRVREALANSYNVPAVRVADDVGLPTALSVLHRAGFESLTASAEHYGLGLALGNGEVSLWEAARAYAGFAHGGRVMPLKPILEAQLLDGTQLVPPLEMKPRRFADSQAVALVTHILSDNAARARAFGLSNSLRLPFAVAAKTGTSKGYSDNWTVGFTRERTVAVWAGNFDGTPMVQVSGITGAGPIFRRVMTQAMHGLAPAALVSREGLESAAICPLSGGLAGPQCPATVDELFVKGTAPMHSCSMHRALAAALTPDVAQRCVELAHAEGRLVDLGLDFYDWAKNEGLAREPWLSAICFGDVRQAGTAVLHPSEGDEFLLFDDLPLADQAIPLRVRAPSTMGSLDVFVDGQRVISLTPPYTGRVPATKGTHRLQIRAAGEVVAEVRYVVRQEPRL